MREAKEALPFFQGDVPQLDKFKGPLEADPNYMLSTNTAQIRKQCFRLLSFSRHLFDFFCCIGSLHA